MRKIMFILTTLMFAFLMIGCRKDFQPRDAHLEWFDPTVYNQEVFDKCYGDGYVFWVPGDPYHCPIYTQAELNAKFSDYLNEIELTFIQDLGRNNVDESIELLKTEYQSLTDDEEILKRISVVSFYTVVATDNELNEKIVYIPSYMPKGVETRLFIYDYPMSLSFIKIKETIEENEGLKSVFEFNGYNWNANNDKIVQIYQLEMILSMDIFDGIRLTRNSSIFLGELHFEMMIDYKAYDDDILVEDAERQIFGLIDEKTLNIFAYTGRDDQDEITYDIIYQFDIE